MSSLALPTILCLIPLSNSLLLSLCYFVLSYDIFHFCMLFHAVELSHAISFYFMVLLAIPCWIMFNPAIPWLCFLMTAHAISCWYRIPSCDFSCYLLISSIIMCYLVLSYAIECYLVLFSVILCFLVLSHADIAYHLVISPTIS